MTIYVLDTRRWLRDTGWDGRIRNHTFSTARGILGNRKKIQCAWYAFRTCEEKDVGNKQGIGYDIPHQTRGNAGLIFYIHFA